MNHLNIVLKYTVPLQIYKIIYISKPLRSSIHPNHSDTNVELSLSNIFQIWQAINSYNNKMYMKLFKGISKLSKYITFNHCTFVKCVLVHLKNEPMNCSICEWIWVCTSSCMFVYTQRVISNLFVFLNIF